MDQPRASSEESQRDEEIKTMTTKDILEKAKEELADLTGFKSPSAIGFKKEGNELIATIEVIEKESIPDGMDVLGTYEVRVGDSGKIIGYERIGLRKRVDTNLDKVA
ncbi:MAG: gas vesicle protein GvpO [Candidatus Yanofskybacteria bacterium]|nr:gas vesicle protein GvpO [Candidatus Yanofskybacteria bacterium]